MKITDNWPAKLGSLITAILIYVYLQNTKLLSRTVNVPIDYPRLEGKLEYGKGNPKTITVRVSGKRELVSYYSQFMKAALVKKEFTPGLNEVFIKKIDGVPNGINVSLKSDKIIVYIEEKIEKTVSLDVVFKDKPHENFLVSSYFIKPNKVKIYGRKSLVSSVKKIKLVPISLIGKKESFAKLVRIDDLPRGITLANAPKEVVVRVNIAASLSSQGEQTVSGIPVKCTGLDEGLEAELDTEEVTVKIYANKAVSSYDVIQGLTATLTCNYLYDRVAKKILPNDKPVFLKVKINKTPVLQDIEILKINPVRIKATFKIKSVLPIPEGENEPENPEENPEENPPIEN